MRDVASSLLSIVILGGTSALPDSAANAKHAAESFGLGSPNGMFNASRMDKRVGFVGGLILVVAGCLVYLNSLAVPLLLDDAVTIAANPSIRRLWPIGPVLTPPPEIYSSGRPVYNLSYALNYAVGGQEVRGYHVVNLAIHLAAALLLFGVIGRTLALPKFGNFFERDAPWLALLTALLWELHPVQTEAVTYISQRSESLMGFFYLATLYCFIRGVGNASSRLWQGLAVVSCLLGMATKEVMVTAPVLVLIFDRTFLAASWREMWQRRRWCYAALAATWLALAYLMVSSKIGLRNIGGEGHITAWTYAMTECQVVVAYLKLALWPHPLIFYYGPELYQWSANGLQTLLCASLLLVIFGASVIGLWRGKAAGFLGVGFFLLLAPTSSVVPVAQQPMAESREYLPLAMIITAAVMGAYAAWGRRSFPWMIVIAIGAGGLSIKRNYDYRSALAIWSDTAEKQPQSSRVHSFLGVILADIPGRKPEAIAQFEAALRINPNYADARSGLGSALATLSGRTDEAIAHLEAALRLDPNNSEAHNNLASTLEKIPGCLPEAIDHYETALRLNPNFALAHYNLGNLLMILPGRQQLAIEHLEAAVSLVPRLAAAHFDLGALLSGMPGRQRDAIAHYEATVRVQPDFAEAQNNLGVMLGNVPGREAEAIAHFEAALRAKPGFVEARANLDALTARTR